MISLCLLAASLLPQAPTPELVDAGLRYPILADGQLGWAAPPSSVSAAADALVWPCRVYLNAGLSPAQLQLVRRSFAEAVTRISACSGGRLQLQPRFVSHPQRLSLSAADFPTPSRHRPLGCSGRGVRSVFLFFAPGTVDLPMAGGTLGFRDGPDGAGASAIACIQGREKELPLMIVHEWLHQLEEWLRPGSGPLSFAGIHDQEEIGAPDEWALVRAILGADLAERDLRQQPVRALPAVEPGAAFGFPGLALRALPGRIEVRWQGQLQRMDLRSRSDLWLPIEGGFLVLVRGDLYPLYRRRLCQDDGSPARDLGRRVLPRPRRQLRGWEVGGTATLVGGFVVRAAFPRPGQLGLSRGPATQRRWLVRSGPQLLAGPLHLQLRGEGPAATLDGAPWPSRKARVPESAARGSFVIGLGRQGSFLVPADSALEMVLGPRSGPLLLTRSGAAWQLLLHNRSDVVQDFVLELWAAPGLRLKGLPTRMRLAAGARRDLALEFEVEADHPPMATDLLLVARSGTRRLGQVRCRPWVAVGRALWRLDFEDSRLSRVAEGAARPLPGIWQTRRVRGGAHAGAGSLELRDGGGSRFGHHSLWSQDGLSYDTKQFPYLGFALRRASQPGARLFCTVHLTDGRVASFRIQGRFRRAWDQRRELRPAAVDQGEAGWQWVDYDLDQALEAEYGKDSYRVQGISLGDSRRLCSNRYPGADEARFGIDSFVVQRRRGFAASDHLRGLCARYLADPRGREDGALERALAELDLKSLPTQAYIDARLLAEALAARRVARQQGPKAQGQAAGRERLLALLRHRHHLQRSPEQILAIGRQQVRSHQQQLAALAGTIAAGKSWRQVATLLADRHCSAEELPRFARTVMQQAQDFCIQNNLLQVPMAARRSQVLAVRSGRRSRTYPFGGYGGSRRKGAGYQGTYFVSPPADWMDAAQARARLRGNHKAWTRVVALHEIVPGHHLQTVVHQLRPLSTFRRRFYSTVFAEGWALYCEDLLFRHGYFPDADTRFAQLQMRLWRAARMVLDVGLHTGELSQREAAAYLVREVGLNAENAAAEVRRYIDNPSRPLSYLLGYLMIVEMRQQAAGREGFDERRFHDQLLRYGPIPLPLLREVLARQEGR